MKPDAKLSAGLAAVRHRFLIELVDRLDRLDRLGDDLDRPGAVTEAQQIFHRIAGTAAMVGYPELGTLARELDDGLTGIAAGPLPRRLSRLYEDCLDLCLSVLEQDLLT